jgi:hypothetical protein
MSETADADFGANPTPTAKSQSAFLRSTENRYIPYQFAEPDDLGRWVVFEYCISLIAVTLRRTSRPIYINPGQQAWIRGLPYVGISLLLGWWGLPWGVIYTPVTIFANLSGGRDITAQVRSAPTPRA